MKQLEFVFRKNSLQGDEEVIDRLYSYLVNTFSRLTFETKVPLKNLFPEPESNYLRSFWANNSHADVIVKRHGHLVCIIEPGGSAHFSDKKQRNRDKKKDSICKLNGVNVLRVGNSFVDQLNRKATKRLLKKYFYGNLS